MFTINLDISQLIELNRLEESARKEIQAAAAGLAAMTHGKLVELAQSKLRARRQLYVDGLTFFQSDEDVWIVQLAADVRWIDDGQPAHDMLDDLLASSKARTAKDGSRYVVVPFEHGPGKGPGTTTPAQQDLTSTVKAQMKMRGIPFGTIETNGAGVAKIGRLHHFDVTNAPIKTADGPGQGHGPVGAARQGPTGIPFLRGVSVYQTPSSKAKSGAKRSILTFRTASSKHRDGERWHHPGLPATNLMEEALRQATEEWEHRVAPSIVARIVAGID